MFKTTPFFQEQKRKDKQFALVIGFLNVDFCSEKVTFWMKTEKTCF